MSDIGKRMRTLREGIGLSQAKFGKIAGIPQATINRYETGYSAAPIKVLIWYADYFDVSMDYICCRTEKPQGKLYEYKPKILEEDKDMRRFVEMCFDPASPMNDRLKKAIIEMLEGVLESMAEYYSAELSQKIRRGMDINAEKCLSNGSNPGLGCYVDEERCFHVDPEGAAVVREIFEMYASGKTVAEITKYLNAKQIKTSQGKEFNKNSLYRLLRNKRYIGYYITRKLKAYVLDLFADFASKEYPGQELTPEIALSFRRSLYDLAPNSVSQYMKQLRSAFSFMLDAGLVEGENPVRPVFVGQEKYQPYDTLLTSADIQRLLRDGCPDQLSGRVYIRARAMTLLCLSSGLRLAELLALALEDLDWVQGKALVRHGKGEQTEDRSLPSHCPGGGEGVSEGPTQGLPRRPAPVCPGSEKKGGFKPLSTRTAQYNISQYVEGITGRTDISPHDPRHSAASVIPTFNCTISSAISFAP